MSSLTPLGPPPRTSDASGEEPFDLPSGGPLLAHQRGLFTWGRYHAEKNQLPEPKEDGQ